MLLVAFNFDPNFLIEMLLVESCLSKSKPKHKPGFAHQKPSAGTR